MSEEHRRRIADFIQTNYGTSILYDREERMLRMVEEVVELAQAEDLTEGDVHRIVTRTFSRPVGQPNQEATGVYLTLLAWEFASRVDVKAEAEKELDRIESLPKEHFRKRHQAKVDDGTAIPMEEP